VLVRLPQAVGPPPHLFAPVSKGNNLMKAIKPLTRGVGLTMLRLLSRVSLV
jgi:hypothetical protein